MQMADYIAPTVPQWFLTMAPKNGGVTVAFTEQAVLQLVSSSPIWSWSKAQHHM
jgi:hypothetical protein